MAATSQEDFANLWADAQAQYEKCTKRSLEVSPKVNDLNELIDCLEVKSRLVLSRTANPLLVVCMDLLTLELRQFEAWRSKRQKMRDVLWSVCEPIQVLGRLVSGPSSMTFPPSAMCFGAITHLIDVAKKTSEDLDAVSEMMETLKNFLTRRTVEAQHAIPPEMQFKHAQILCTLLQLFGEVTKVVSRRAWRLKNYGTVTLLGSNKTIAALVSRLQTLVDSEDKLTSAETYASVRQLG